MCEGKKVRYYLLFLARCELGFRTAIGQLIKFYDRYIGL